MKSNKIILSVLVFLFMISNASPVLAMTADASLFSSKPRSSAILFGLVGAGGAYTKRLSEDSASGATYRSEGTLIPSARVQMGTQWLAEENFGVAVGLGLRQETRTFTSPANTNYAVTSTAAMIEFGPAQKFGRWLIQELGTFSVGTGFQQTRNSAVAASANDNIVNSAARTDQILPKRSGKFGVTFRALYEVSAAGLLVGADITPFQAQSTYEDLDLTASDNGVELGIHIGWQI